MDADAHTNHDPMSTAHCPKCDAVFIGKEKLALHYPLCHPLREPCPCCGAPGHTHIFRADEHINKGDVVTLNFLTRKVQRFEPEPEPLAPEEEYTLDRATRDGTLPFAVCCVSLRRLFLLARKVKS